MESTIRRRAVLTVDGDPYDREAPARGDVVALSTLTNASPVVFRIWGLPGETIAFSNAGVTIDGIALKVPAQILEAVELDHALAPGPVPFVSFPYRLSASGVFVMGDNLRNAYDSRYLGEVLANRMLGRVRLP